MRVLGAVRDSRYLVGTVLAVVIGGATLAGCGSDDSPTSTTGGEAASQSSSAAVQAATAKVSKYLAAQSPIVVPAIGEPVPRGKTVAIITCPLPICQVSSKVAATSAKALGWSVKSYSNPLTPEGYVSVWGRVLQTPPDGVVYIGAFPNSLIPKQIASAKELKIPLVDIAPAGDRPTRNGPLVATLAGPAMQTTDGTLMGEVVVADSKQSPPEVTYLYDKALEPAVTPVRAGFTGAIEKAGGSVSLLTVSSADVGKSIPGQVVSYLQAHPDVKYLGLQYDDLAIGVPEALQAAGLGGKVKIVGRAPQAANLKYIRNGQQFASVADENETSGYRGIDVLARVFVGNQDYELDTEGWHQIITKANVAELDINASGLPATPGSPAAFAKAWGVAGL